MRFRNLFGTVLLSCLLAITAHADSPECLISFDSARLDVCSGQWELTNADLDHLASTAVYSDSSYRVVKFDRPLRSSDRDALTALGVEVLGYVPHYAWKVRMHPSLDQDVAALNDVIWVGPYLPVWKVGVNLALDLELGNVRGTAPDIDLLTVTLHQGAGAERVSNDLLAIPGLELVSTGDSSVDEYLVMRFQADQLSTIVDDLAVNEHVAAVKLRFPNQMFNSQGVWLHQSGEHTPPQTPLFDQGLYGCGQTIGMLDSGMDVNHCSFEDPDPDSDFPYEHCTDGVNCQPLPAGDDHRKVAAFYHWETSGGTPGDSHNHGTAVAGNIFGSNWNNPLDCESLGTPGAMEDVDGMAPGARAIVQAAGGGLDYLNTHGGNVYHAATTAFASGAYIHNNSWGSSCSNLFGCISGCQIEYRDNSRYGDLAVWENPELLIVAAAGNDGGGDGGGGCGVANNVGSPANGKSVFAIGGNQRGQAGNNTYMNSSRGPVIDRRTKPDILAQSQSVMTSNVNTACGTRSATGTSFGSPTAAGISALVREYLQRGFYPLGFEVEANEIPDPSAALIRALMINGAVEITGTGSGSGFPNQNIGWGRLLADNALYFDGDDRLLWLHDEKQGLDTGQTDVHHLSVDSGQDLIVTLIWHDYPAELNSNPHIVNQLRLEVETPSGDVWTQKLSPGGGINDPNPFQGTTLDDYDDRNTVHQIVLAAPESGDYEIRVSGIQLAMGDAQPYALVATGDLLGIGDPDFMLQPQTDSVAVCQADDANFDIGVFSVTEFEDPVDLAVTDGLPAGASASFSVNPVIPADPANVSQLTISGTSAVAVGSYEIELTGESNGPEFDPITKTISLNLTVDEGLGGPGLLQPVDGATNVDLLPEFSWDALSGAAEYQIQVSTDAGFGTTIIDETVTAANFTPATDLATGSDFYWRVRANNACGDGAWSDVFEFQTRFEPISDISPDEFNFSVQAGQTASLPLFIENIGTGELAWSIGSDEAGGDCSNPTAVDWLSGSPPSGETSPGPATEVDIIVDADTLAHGQHEATLCVTSNTTVGDQIVAIPVHVNAIDPTVAFLEGHVTSLGVCSEPGGPLQEATVSVQGQNNLFEMDTDADGFYSFEISDTESPVTITVSAELHATEVRPDVVLNGGQSNIEDFDLAGDTACIEVDPTSFSLTLAMGQSADEDLDIFNVGTQTLEWTIPLPEEFNGRDGYVLLEDSGDIELPDFVSDVNDAEAGFERFEQTISEGESQLSRAARNQLLRDGVLLVPNTGNGRIIALDPETGDIIDPDFIDISTAGSGAMPQALLHPDGERILLSAQTGDVVHAFDSEGEYLGIFAPAGGVDTSIIDNVRGMAFHPDTGNLLVTAGQAPLHSVAEFDLEGNYLGDFIESGAGGLTSPWGLQFRDADVLLSASSGSIYSYTHSGVFNEIWNSDINFPQQIKEIDSGNILAAAFSSPSGVWELDPDGGQIAIHGPQTSLRGVHELPGGTILVTNGSGIHEIDRNGNLLRTLTTGSSYMISLVHSLDCNMPSWVDFDITSGTINAGGPADTVTVSFNPDGLTPGLHEGNFCVESNDPVEPAVQVSLSLEVELPADYATIEGTVETSGFCAAGEVIPLEGATVTIDGAEGSHELTADENGFYQIFLPDSESPVDLTVSAPDHITQSLNGISFSGGDLLVHDFLLDGDSACIDVDPDALVASTATGTQTDETFDVSNFGSQALDWSIEGEGFGRAQSDPLIGFTFKTTGSSGDDPQNWERIGVNSGTIENAMDDTGAATEVTFEWGIMSGTMSFIAAGTVASDAVPEYDYDLTGMNGYAFGSAGRYFYEFTDLNANAPYEIWFVGYRSGSAIDQTVQISDGANEVGDPGAIEFIQEITSGANNGRFIVNDVIADDSMNWNELSLITTSNADGEIRIEVERNSQSTSVGAIAIRPAMDCEIPEWLSFVPDSGLIGPGDPAQTVTATFDAMGLLPGDYEDAFCVSSNDPVRPEVMVPVSFTVGQSPDIATLEGTVQSSGFCGSAEMTDLEGATVFIEGALDTYTATTDGNGFYQLLLPIEEDPVDITVSADNHLDETSLNVTLVGGGVVVEDFVLDGDSACIDVTPTALSAAVDVGQSVDQTFEVANTGTNTLDWLVDTSSRDGSDPLIGFNFTTSGSSTPDPQNWTRIGAADGSLSGVMDDTGEATDVGISWGGVGSSLGYVYLGTSTLAADAVPQHDYDLSGMTGYGFRSGGHLFIEIDGLQPNALYEYWFVAYRGGSNIDNIVQVSDGDVIDAIEFNQFITSANNDGRFIVNDQTSSDQQIWDELSFVTHADSNGVITVQYQGDTQTPVIGAFAIRMALDCTIPDWLSIAPQSGSISPGGGAETVTATLDATGLVPGDYSATICVESNDPTQPVVPVEVAMEVDYGSDFGLISGLVNSLGHCTEDPFALEGATLEVTGQNASYEFTSDESGLADIAVPIDESPVDIIVSAEGHQPVTVNNVDLIGGEWIDMTFDLVLEAPCAAMVPASIEISLDAGTSTSGHIELNNFDGTAPLTWTIDEAPGMTGAADPRAHFPSEPVFVEHKNDANVSAGLDPWQLENQAQSATGNGLLDTFEVPAYSTTGYTASGYITMDAVDPATMTVINANQPTNIYAGTFVDNDLDTHYVLSSDGGDLPAHTLGTIDVATGDFTALGTVSGGIGTNWASLVWDHSTRTLFGVASNTLFTIDLDTLEATQVGPIDGPGMSPTAIIVTTAISPEGLMYAIDIADDVLIAVDKTTGDAAVIGSLGIDVNFAQDMDFDQSTGILYWPAYMGGGASEMYTVDTETAELTLVAPIASGDEMLSFTIAVPGGGADGDVIVQCNDPQGIPWLSAAPVFGVTHPGMATTITVGLDATDLQPGEYHAGLCVASNDPVNPILPFPVSLSVRTPSDWDHVDGTVTSLGYCGDAPEALEGAELTFTAPGYSQTISTAADGSYSIPLDPELAPYDVTVTHPDHLPVSESGITPPATVDFDLALDAACVTVDPDEIVGSALTGGVDVQTLTIGNLGSADLNWTMETANVPAGQQVLPPFAVDSGAARTDLSLDLAELLGGELPSLSMSQGEYGLRVVDCDSEPGIMINDDGTVENGYGANAAVVSEVRFVDRYTPEEYPAVLSAVCVAFLTIDGTTSFDIEVIAYDDSGAGGTPGVELGRLAATVDVDQLSPPVPPNHPPVWNSIDLSSLGIEVTDGSVYVGVTFVPQTISTYIAADQSTDRPVGHAGGFWWTDNTGVWTPVQTDYPDYRSLMIRPVLMTEMSGCDFPEDVPWLSTSPTSGTVAGGDSATVDVMLDATGLVPGTYEAELCVNSNDASNPLISVPVTFDVLGGPNDGILTGTVSSLGYCSDDPSVLEGALIEVEGSLGGTFSTTTDADGSYELYIDAGESPITVSVSADDHLGDSVNGIGLVAQETTVVDFDLVLEAACATVEPEEINESLSLSGVRNIPLTIGNEAGGADLNWTMDTAWAPAGQQMLPPFDIAGSGERSPAAADLAGLLGGTLPSLSMVQPAHGLRVVDCDSEPGIMINDDGTVENGYGANAAVVSEVRFVDRYTPEEYPAVLSAVCVAFLTIDGTTSFDIEVIAYDDSGAGGTPGVELGRLAATVDVDQLSPPVPPNHPPVWNSIDLSSLGIEVTDGSVYVGVTFVPQTISTYIAADQSTDRPVGHAGGFWWTDNTGVWTPVQTDYPDYRSLMIRPVLLTELAGCSFPEDVPWLSVSPDSGSVAAGGSGQTTVTIDGSQLVEGTNEAVLCLNSNDSQNPVISIPVTIEGLNIPAGELAVDPLVLDFGEAMVGSSDTVLSLTVSNVADAGADALVLEGLDVVGSADFAVSGGDCALDTALEPGESCEVEVTFAPTTQGPLSGDLAVLAGGEQELVSLLGVGIVPDPGALELTPAEHDFGAVGLGDSSSFEFTLSNTAPAGHAAVEIASMAVVGSGDFAIGDNSSCEAAVPGEPGDPGEPGTMLEPGESCTIEIVYAPSAVGDILATLLVEGTAGEISSATLIGEGSDEPPADEIFSDRFEEMNGDDGG